MNKTGEKPTNTWVSLCSVTKRLADWGELLRVRLGVRFPSGVPRRSKLCIACSDLFYKSERAHAAAPPLQTKSVAAGVWFESAALRRFFIVQNDQVKPLFVSWSRHRLAFPTAAQDCDCQLFRRRVSFLHKPCF